MFGESKYDILMRLPPHVLPKTRLVKPSATAEQLLALLKTEGFSFPMIFKPDIGERGYRVKRIFTTDDARNYLDTAPGDFIVQELLELPVECGVFYTRFPDEEKGVVTSLVIKEMLSVTGDGQSSLQQLIMHHDRAKLQWERLKNQFGAQLNEVPRKDEPVELNPIGNHCLGTKFLNGNMFIDDELSASFDGISKAIGDFYFGRYDLKCASMDDLKKGNVKIMEVNGCGAEPAHIYHPGFSLWEAWGVLFGHWKNLHRISVQNHRKGVPYTSFPDGIRIFKKFRAALQP
ncbi:hypothetical protein QQ054_07370 [Oscillatoria amoena NRMC-F 0135]|nr:hypothetical protein [Oscillatoria amoena NRMC-F 0135]